MHGLSKTHFSGALLSIRAENVSKTRFQMPKLDHENTPNDPGVLLENLSLRGLHGLYGHRIPLPLYEDVVLFQ